MSSKYNWANFEDVSFSMIDLMWIILFNLSTKITTESYSNKVYDNTHHKSMVSFS